MGILGTYIHCLLYTITNTVHKGSCSILSRGTCHKLYNKRGQILILLHRFTGEWWPSIIIDGVVSELDGGFAIDKIAHYEVLAVLSPAKTG